MALDGFEVFQKRRGRATDSINPTISVRSNGSLVISGAALAMFGVPPTHVVLMYNPRIHKVAIVAADENDPNAYKLRPSGKSSITKEVGAKAFLEANDIPLTSRTYEAVKLDSAITFGMDQVPRRGRRPNAARTEEAA